MSLPRPGIKLVFILFVTLISMRSGKNLDGLLKLPTLSQISSLTPMVPNSPSSTTSEVDIDVMDYYVPLQPYEGDTIEISCGFKDTKNIKMRRLEWYRITNNHQFLFFHLSSSGDGDVYEHDEWFQRSQISYYFLNKDGYKSAKQFLSFNFVLFKDQIFEIGDTQY